ncbi:MAG: DUF58 domain-containing protein [Candidatus Magnetobacterium sp. LHC-1]|uniref:DUF58 domain-containing protein n=1 Tax=Candidatus Magnetobacterium casense TaxID=1455061 RepID=A0ABS6RUT1_9BACT|nr:DUF58 domain-containing protein [Candidatus Magnetobacterium casensis]MBF0608099.1 DUF58 domain-containing protein [Nitrospirota bacterium]MBV6340105.1 DUF58 domain-containing protein [Candidatus Magnetobacterium casensis]
MYILLSIFLGFAATNTGNNLIYMITAALLSFMGISGFFGRTNLLKVRVGLEFPDEVYAGRQFPLKVLVTNNKAIMPGFILRIVVGSDEVRLPYVAPKGEAYRHLNISLPRRGKHVVREVHVCSVFPFNFFIRCVKLNDLYECIVLPEPKRCQLPEHLQREMRSKGEKSTNMTGYDGELLSLRKYRPSDPIKYISWKATAKTGQLKTKELSALAFEPIVIDFDKTNISDYEARISCITYAISSLIKQNIPVGLKLNDKVFNPEVSHRHKLNMLRQLALLP